MKMEYVECVVTRPDGTTFFSRRTARLKLILGNGETKLCTSLAHCAALLNVHLGDCLEKRITVNHLHRRSARLVALLEQHNIQLEYCERTRITPTPVNTPANERHRWFTNESDEAAQ